MITDEQQETIVNEVLRKFCDNLNSHWNKDFPDEPNPYTLEKFTVTDHERNLYGETNWKVLEQPDEEAAFQNALMKIDAADGDDGGGSILYVGLEGINLGDNDPVHISWIVHIFDTIPRMLWTHEDGFTS
jgi:hypothetical protein